MNVIRGHGALSGPFEQPFRFLVSPAHVKPDVRVRSVLPVGETRNALDVLMAVIVLDEVRLLRQRTPVGDEELPVELEILAQAHDERDPVLEEEGQVLVVIVSCVHDGELRVHPHLPKFLDGPGQGRHVDHVSRAMAEIDRQTGSMVDDVYEPHLAADFSVVVADGGKRKVDAVGQPCAVDEDVAQPFPSPRAGRGISRRTRAGSIRPRWPSGNR